MSSSALSTTRAGRAWEASLIAALVGLAVLAWGVTEWLATPPMRVGLLTGSGATATSTAASLATVGLFVVTWTVMMAAMMLPAVAPVVVTVDRWAARMGRPRRTTWLFVAGYLLAWGASGLVVYAAMAGVVPWLPTGAAAVRAGAVVLVVAGAYQFTPAKRTCLRHCRSPLAFVAQHTTRLRRGGLSGAGVGVVHGFFCLGCCWALMIVLILLGMMSLTWMAAVAAVVLSEKALPARWPVGALVGVTLISAGVVLFVAAHPLPALS